MLEMGLSGLMSGEGKPPAASRSRSSALPRLYFLRKLNSTPNSEFEKLTDGYAVIQRHNALLNRVNLAEFCLCRYL